VVRIGLTAFRLLIYIVVSFRYFVLQRHRP